MADIFEKGIENLNDRDPIIVLCGEVGSMVGRFSDGNLSESKTTEDLIDVYHTKFKGKEGDFENILNLMKRTAKELPSMSENGSFVSKALLNTFLDFLIKDDVENTIKFYNSVSSSLDDYMFNRNDEVFVSKVMNTLSLEDKNETGLQVISPKWEKPSFTINEIVNSDKKEDVKAENTANENENASKKQEKYANHPLWYVLSNIRREDPSSRIEYTDSEGNKRYATDYQYTRNPDLISDKSTIFFPKSQRHLSSGKVGPSGETTVAVGNNQNSLNISHKKNEETSKEAMLSSVRGVVDYMEAKDEIPFEFKINTKSDEFKRDMVSIILMYVRMNEIRSKLKQSNGKNKVFEVEEVETDSNGKTKADEFDKYDRFVLKGKVSSFNIDGMIVSYGDFAKFKSYDDFVKFEEKKAEKDKEEVRERLLANELVNNVAK